MTERTWLSTGSSRGLGNELTKAALEHGDRVVATFGRLDVVANNAGYANSAAIEDMDQADFRAQIETDLCGVVNVTCAALPVLRAQRVGHFLQFSSIGRRVGGTAGVRAYQTAKFAVKGFSEVLNTEVRPLGIKVTGEDHP